MKLAFFFFFFRPFFFFRGAGTYIGGESVVESKGVKGKKEGTMSKPLLHPPPFDPDVSPAPTLRPRRRGCQPASMLWQVRPAK